VRILAKVRHVGPSASSTFMLSKNQMQAEG
jgi:hypothetical protein